MITPIKNTLSAAPDPATAPLEFLQHLYAAAVRRAMPLHTLGAFLPQPPKGRTVVVTILPNGFEYEGEVYRSLSAVAKAVTGTHWNGYHFFDLLKGGDDHA